MQDVLSQWILENRPYTHLSTRVRHFLLYCRRLQPGLSYTALQRHVAPLVDSLMLGDVGRLWLRDRAFERVLRLYGQNDQRSAQWHTKRGEMITASEVYKVFGTTEGRKEVMLRKLEPPSTGDSAVSNPIPALLWGTRFEPVAKRIYEETTRCTILDVSCAQHPRYPFLGASPDGLIIPLDDDPKRYGRLVEFKCPMSRVEKPEIPARRTYFKDIAVLAMPAEGVVAKDQILDLSAKLCADGELAWDAPAGQWTIYRFGHTTMGTLMQPAQWAANGFECDKMNPDAVAFHMSHVIGEIKKHLGDLIVVHAAENK